jgi:hypothetical protein
MFCAVIPMAASLGTAASVRLKDKRKQAEARGQAAPKIVFPVEKATVAVIAALVVSAWLYHTATFPPLR